MIMHENNAKIIREFMEDFIENATDNDAIYLIETLMSACKYASEHPDKVAAFVEAKKRAKRIKP